MAKYNFFQGGPAATDLSGIFAKLDTGALARGVASAGQSIGNAITERYVQTKKEKEDAALTDQFINSDLGDDILKWNKLSREQYKGLNDSAKSRLLPAYQTGLTLQKAADDLDKTEQINDSADFVKIANNLLFEPYDGTAVENLDELERRTRVIMGHNLTREDRKDLLDRIDNMKTDLEEDLPIGVLSSGLNTKGEEVDLENLGVIGFDVNGKKQVMNLPSKEDKKSPEAIFAKDLAALEKLVNEEPDNLNAKSMLKHMKEAALRKVTPSGSRKIIRDQNGNIVYEEVTGTGISASQKSESEKYLFAYERGVGSLDTFAEKIKPSQLGVQGQISEALIDNFLVDWFPDNSSMKKSAGKRIETRQAMRLWSEESLRTGSGDTRFSVPDRLAIERITQTPDMWTTYAKATISMRKIRDMFQRNSRQKLRELGRADYPDWVKTPSMIREEVEDGTMDLIDAEQWMGRMHPDYANWLGMSLDDVLFNLKEHPPKTCKT